MKYLKHIVLIPIFLIAILSPLTIAAQSKSSTYTMEPSVVSLDINEHFTITVNLDSGSNPVNAASLHLSYPSSLKFVGSSFAGSALPNIIEREESTGTLKYTTFIINPVQGEGKFVDLEFMATQEGSGQIEYLSSSGIYLADGSGTNDLNQAESTSLSFTISQTVSANPTVDTLEENTEDGEVRSGIVDYTADESFASLPGLPEDSVLPTLSQELSESPDVQIANNLTLPLIIAILIIATIIVLFLVYFYSKKRS